MDEPITVDILLVEDNPHDAELTMRALKKSRAANHMFVVTDGEEALDFVFEKGKFARRESHCMPKVILLDLKLPKLDGLDVLKAIKSDDRSALIPVVVVTSSREDPDIQAAYQLGANSYVVKPVDFNGFMEVMNQVSLYWLRVNQPLV